jgi:hypothetical protein
MRTDQGLHLAAGREYLPRLDGQKNGIDFANLPCVRGDPVRTDFDGPLGIVDADSISANGVELFSARDQTDGVVVAEARSEPAPDGAGAEDRDLHRSNSSTIART